MENEEKSIHEIFKAAFEEAEKEHNIRIKNVDFDFMKMLDGSVHLTTIKLDAETIK